jgi:hypothetical protein
MSSSNAAKALYAMSAVQERMQPGPFVPATVPAGHFGRTMHQQTLHHSSTCHQAIARTLSPASCFAPSQAQG